MPTAFGSDLMLPNAREIHLWQLHLPAAKPYQQVWQSYLTTEEGDRALRFVKSEDAERFICSRGGLRDLLGRYLHCAPRSLVFRYGDYGKPSLAHTHDVSFNVSHSGPWMIYGVSRCPWLGVDVEHIVPRRHLEGLIRRCLTPQEQRCLPTKPALRLHQFLTYWTAKEAHLKAVGLGLNYPLSKVQIALSPTPSISIPAALTRDLAAEWSLHVWQPAPTAIAAVCVGDAVSSVSIRAVGEMA